MMMKVVDQQRLAVAIIIYVLGMQHVRWAVRGEARAENETSQRTIENDDVERGSVVVRGPDWKWGNQDGGKGQRGVVVDIMQWAGESDPGKYAVRVRWDATSFENAYRYGAQGARDVQIIGRRSEWETSKSYRPTHTLSILDRNDMNKAMAVKASSAQMDAAHLSDVCARRPKDGSECSSRVDRMSSRQRNALLDIWRETTKTTDKAKRNTQWISSKRWQRSDRANPCKDRWEGVVCDPDMEVVALDLSNNNLIGTLPSSVVRLSSLRSLTLANNRKLSGHIPAEGLERVAHLRFFAAHNDALEGPLPTQIGSLRELEWLSLYNNRLTGTVPSELGDCEKMGSLFLQMNRLTGPLPASLGKLKSLRVLSLHHNDLTGFIPRSIAVLELTQFSVVGTKLRFPSTIDTSSSIFKSPMSPIRRRPHGNSADDGDTAHEEGKKSGG